MTALIDRLLQPDVATLPDWQAAEVLNAPDQTLPVVVEWKQTAVGIGLVMNALGPQDGAALLEALSSMENNNPLLRWGLRALQQNGLDFSLVSTRNQIEALVADGLLTPAQRDALFSMSRRERYPSWSEFHGIAVDARAVGLARGAKE
jgi:hypothetical protein